MSRPSGSVKTPSYRLHRPSGQAVVTLGARDHYLGLWKSKASLAEYDRLVSEWLASGRQVSSASDLTVTELLAGYWRWGQEYFASSGESSGQVDNLRSVIKIVRRLYGHTPAESFGPLALRAVQAEFVGQGWARTHVNAQVGRVRRIVKWGVANELLPQSALYALQAVEGLRYGKSTARESEPIKSVSAPFIDAVLPHLSLTVRSMVELQAISGMRSSELCQMRSTDLDTKSEPWVYRPEGHKNRHRGHDRSVYLGARARAIVEKHLKLDPQSYLFSPRDAEAERAASRQKARKTPLNDRTPVGVAETCLPFPVNILSQRFDGRLISD